MFAHFLLAALLQDGLVANGTFDKSADGWAMATRGASYRATEGRTGGAVHLSSQRSGANSLEVAKCFIPTIPPGKALKLTAWVKGSDIKGMVSIAVQGWNKEKTELTDFATSQKETFLNGTFGWKKVETTLHPGPQAASAAILLILADKGEAWFDDVTLTEAGASAPATSFTGSPGVFEIRGQSTYTASKNGANGKLLFPLPLEYREQVPLGYRFQATPAELVKGQRVYEDRPGNYVLELELATMKGGQSVTVDWSSCVLAGPRPSALPKKAAFPNAWPLEARSWLKSTWCVQSADPKFQAIGKELRSGGADVPAVVDRVIAKAEEIRSRQGEACTSLDALQALEKSGSCTSNANLVAALLRSARVPARVLAGYPSWAGPLQTHYNVEAYVPDYGWYLIESTLLKPWTPFGQIQVSIVPVEHEDRAQGRFFVAPGVPYLSLTEFNGSSITPRAKIDGKDYCDHVCVPVAALEGDSVAWKAALDSARVSWRSWLKGVRNKTKTGVLATGATGQDLKNKTLADLALSK